ncbi:capsular polysaccharide biosynthesis protein [Neisseria montereyensis]|uniref:Capsular polysaccharide biosynthesis protein n=1 Tax=Neisseria montereyensis TaxID=2973938 RepID=A0ABT2FEG3_9NEIS|nr:capsular polysaccharide biosynthesis protein [Neisseria montereyensis]MCS4534532.1 capsular polysaccharide biosynthesis protein [Neisseria montereyensis]
MIAKPLILSKGIWKIISACNFFPEYHFQKNIAQADAVFGWGLRPSTRKAQAYAKQYSLPYIALEDGFIRSLGLGAKGHLPLSLVVDDAGIYYDTTRPSRLEHLILSADSMAPEMLADAGKAISFIIHNKLSKYNHAPEFSDGLKRGRPSEKPIVLVVDQTFGDMAVKYGGANEHTFYEMFQTALSENPDAEIWVKTHPDVLSGKKRGYLTDISLSDNRIRLLAQDINPISLLEKADKVYCVTSQMGFEALLLDKHVVTFGLPWYAGWGISDDRHEALPDLIQQNRRSSRSVVQLFAAAYLQYSRYINPNTDEPGTIFDVMDYLTAARRLNEKLRGCFYCVGMSLWKRAIIKPFFNVPSCRLKFVSSIEKLEKTTLPQDARLLIWGRGNDEINKFAENRRLPAVYMEDGFIRSVGLGSNLVAPLSLVTDDIGIYFDASRPSRLESILENQVFSEQDFQTASYIADMLTRAKISKYNVGGGKLDIPDTQRQILLVPGQVEDDASIRFGSPKIDTNLALLKKVRERHPEAYIIYKPHPDVVSGNRIGAVAVEDAAKYADQVAADCDILTCLEAVDEVHTMTSLAGFEALLRGKTVYCYGLPFYAGWGLTHDDLTVSRRTRKLALWELIAGTLIYYPSYIHPETRRFISVDMAIRILSLYKKQNKNNNLIEKSFLSKQLGKLKQLSASLKSN